MADYNNPIGEGSGANPKYDVEIEDGGYSVIDAINSCRNEAEQARNTRIDQFDRNWDTFLGRQDWSHKQPGQSKEFLPKVPVSAEKLCAVIKMGMIQFGEFFSVELDSDLSDKVSPDQIRAMFKAFLFDLWGPANVTQNFPTIISDAVKQALFKSLIILKVHGGDMVTRKYTFEKGDPEPKVEEADEWHLRIDCCRVEDYYPDPTGNGLYEIHRVERDIHQILAGVEQGIYDAKAVNQLLYQDQARSDDEKLSERDRNQEITVSPSFRRRVVLDEFWGTLLNDDGSVAHRNILATVANGRVLIRPPEPNPFWHQESPFVVAPLIRVPFSVWHKALYDHSSDLNLAINELFNLIVDGGLAAVWGIKQLRLEDLEDPSQVANGIQQGTTLVVKQTLPHNAKVLETVAEADIPREAMAVFEFLNREFDTASMSDGMGMGALPPTNSKTPAVAFLQGSQSQNAMLDGLVNDLETEIMGRVLRKSFLTVLQNADRLPDKAFSSGFDKRAALAIVRAEPAERFALFAGKTQFKVFGLKAKLARALDFQKIMAFLQATATDPMLKQEMMMEFSPRKIIDKLLQTLDINPSELRMSPDEKKQAALMQQRTAATNNMMQNGPTNSQGQPAGVASGPGTGGSPMAATIQQQANPATGMPNM